MVTPVTPGVATRKPRVNRRLPGRRTALIVCQATLRRSGRIRFVGWPLASSSQCRDGYSYGEFRIGCSKNAAVVAMAGRSLAHAPAIPCYGGQGGIAGGTEAS